MPKVSLLTLLLINIVDVFPFPGGSGILNSKCMWHEYPAGSSMCVFSMWDRGGGVMISVAFDYSTVILPGLDNRTRDRRTTLACRRAIWDGSLI